MPALLEISRLQAAFGTQTVLHGVSLRLSAGEKMALVGESGSGKTLLAQAVVRLNPDVRLSGSLKFAGTEILTAPARTLQKLRGREIGMVFQEPMTALNPVQKICRQIGEVMTWHLGLTARQAWTQSVALLKKMGIENPELRAGDYPFRLSGGQRQRVMIAMAVAAAPKLLIADEPTTALDNATAAQILDLLENIRAESGMAVLYISHDLNTVRRFADRVAVMQNGEIVEENTAGLLFRQPEHPYTRALLAAVPTPLDVREAAENSGADKILAAGNLTVAQPRGGGILRRPPPKILLQNISFSLQSGRTLGVIGASGSGKTTLARALMRLIPASGSLNVAGNDWQKLSGRALNAVRSDMQMVFQDPFGALNPRMTVGEIVGEGLAVHAPQTDSAVRAGKIARVLADVGLAENGNGIAARYPHEFSGGQRQRIAIARALIVRPKILVLDEPTSALDVRLQKQLLQLLRALQKKYGLAMVFISHDLAVIRAVAHDILVLENGRVAACGSAAQILPPA